MSNAQNDTFYENLEELLQELPEKASTALATWRMATLDRERVEAVLYLKFKGSGEKRTADEIKAMVKDDGASYAAKLKEIQAESAYNFVYERLLSVKKRASLRTAF